MKFIDLFAGLGCFHFALKKLGNECVYACEINKELNQLYFENHKIKPDYDITKVDISSIPSHDILCAGFPCQSFSKAGRQLGIEDDRGKLINKVIEILIFHKPKFFILENVRNLEKHNKGETWKYIKTEIEKIGYSVDKQILSPHQFGIPQHRERIFIVGSLNGLKHFNWEQIINKKVKFIVETPKDFIPLEVEKIKILETWQSFLNILPKNIKPYSPLWSMEFGADYPYADVEIHKLSINDLKNFKGSFGKPLSGTTKSELLEGLPNYIKTKKGKLPAWKQNYIKNNREFYKKYKKEIDKILPRIIDLGNESWQKFEWNCGDLEKDIWKYYVQFRGSGIRIKKTDYFPSLVTVSTQIPIIGSEKRYISTTEAKNLQSIPNNVMLPKNNAATFRALGNAVNVTIVESIAEELFSLDLKPIVLENSILSFS